LNVRIDSPTNPRIGAAARATREGEALVLEGARMLGDALEAGVVPDVVFASPDLAPADAAALDRAGRAGIEIVEVSPRVLARLSDLGSTRALLALAPVPSSTLAALAGSRLVLLLDGLQDPANVGAILRAAEAFGAGGLILTPGTASPFAPKAFRASAGSALRVPVARNVLSTEVVEWARSRGASLAGADAHDGIDPEALKGVAPLVLAIGSEGHGLSAPVVEALDHRVRIPVSPRVESLNAAVAAGILLYALSPKTSAANR
jgi:TrmH family RNA methyltransferase